MSLPNHFAIVERVNAAHPHLLAVNSRDTIRELYWRIAWALHQHDPNWGMLTKSEAENHQVIEGLRVSCDAIAYKGAVPIVDIIGSAGDGPGTGRITWGVDQHRRESNLWVAPPPFRGAQPAAPPTAHPPQGTADPAEIDRLREVVHGLRSEIAALHARISVLENGTLRYGAPIILRTNGGQVVCAEGGGGGPVNANRTDAGPWETFVVEKP